MTSEQIQYTLFVLAGIIMGGICLRGIGTKVVKGIFKTKNKALAQEKAQSKYEIEKKRMEAFESSINAALEGMREISRTAKQPHTCGD